MDIHALLGDDADALLGHESKGIPKESLQLPGPDFVDRVFAQTDRNPQVLRNLEQLFSTGRLGGSGYVSILPVDQGIEHSGAASFAPHPELFDPENIIITRDEVVKVMDLGVAFLADEAIFLVRLVSQGFRDSVFVFFQTSFVSHRIGRTFSGPPLEVVV